MTERVRRPVSVALYERVKTQLMRVSVIVLGYGFEPHLSECLSAIARQLGPQDELLLWDNGIVGPAFPEIPSGIRCLGDGTNRGFAGGCNAAAEGAKGESLIFVNSDAILHPGAVEVLRGAVQEPDTGIVAGCLRLADKPEIVNSAGNPMHYLGITWAGGFGDPATLHEQPGPVATFSGGLFAVRREVWDVLGGFDPGYFAYHEDADLSLRCWLAGWQVLYAPTAVADHHYAFNRTACKMYLLERNRLITVSTDYPAKLLGVVVPMLLLTEPALLAMAVMQGWGSQKLLAWRWLLTNRNALRLRRREVQERVTHDPDVLIPLLESRIAPPMITAPTGMKLVNILLTVYWQSALRLILTRRSGNAT